MKHGFSGHRSIPCSLYRGLIDPILSSLRRKMSDFISPGSSVLEAACGTGEQAIRFAGKAGNVVGFDSNNTMVECARRRIPAGFENRLSFRHADARNLPFVVDKGFDTATITLAIHEMHQSFRLPVLQELGRCAETLLIADYRSPLPATLGGQITRWIERLAGLNHYEGFCSYQSSGGLDPLLDRAGLGIINEASALGGIVRILLCRRAG